MMNEIPVNPYRQPPDQQGWRGLSLDGGGKRKWYTLLHNEQVLVTALVLLPGESSVRHSHESGELSIWYVDPMQPMVKWNPPGVFHAGPELPTPQALAESAATSNQEPAIQQLLARLGVMEAEIKRLSAAVDELRAPAPKPIVMLDVLFPPFKTIVDDPRFPKKTVVGQWFD